MLIKVHKHMGRVKIFMNMVTGYRYFVPPERLFEIHVKCVESLPPYCGHPSVQKRSSFSCITEC